MKNDNSLDPVQEMTCFKAHKECKKQCTKSDCRYWINHPSSQNCTLIASDEGPHTLQQIGEIFGVTRMRICQIEKSILKKLMSHTAEIEDI
jgi:hypothetical protein